MVRMILCGIVMLMAAGPARAGAAATPTAGKAALPPDVQERFAGGQTLFNDQYVSLDSLLDDYHAVKAQMAEFQAKNKELRNRLAAVKKDMEPLMAKDSAARAPIMADLEKAKARQAEILEILAIRLAPPGGEREAIKQKLRPDGTAVEGVNQGSTAVHPDAPEWRKETAAALVKARLDQMDYQKALAELKVKQDAAQKELTTVDATLKKNAAALADVQAKAPPELKALFAEVVIGEDELKAGENDVKVLQGQIKAMGDSFRLVDEPLRLKYDVVEWEGDFIRLADLEKVAADLKADIAKTRERLAAEAKAAGKPFPADWKPSQQNRLDAALALLAKAQDARAPKPPVKAPKS
jgi:hypothetical protein